MAEVRTTAVYLLLDYAPPEPRARVTAAYLLLEYEPVPETPDLGVGTTVAGRTRAPSRSEVLPGLSRTTTRSEPPGPEAAPRSWPGGVGYVQWMTYVGPPWPGVAEGWDWTGVLVEGSGLPSYPDTTLAVNLSPTDTQMSVADASAWPDKGGCWVGPNGANETWEYVRYTGKSGNILTGLVRETTDQDQVTGIHTAGATVHWWWPLDTAGAELEWNDVFSQNLSAIGYNFSLSGLEAGPYLRPGHMVVVLKRELVGNVWSAWGLFLTGWIASIDEEDDADRLGRWRVQCRDLWWHLRSRQLQGLIVRSDDNRAQNGNARTSSVLSADYKEAHSGEFTAADPDLSGRSAVDGDMGTLWISERMVGFPDPPDRRLDLVAHGVRDWAISHVHLVPYTGQSNGYRYIEFTCLTDGNSGNGVVFNEWLIVGVDRFLNMEGTSYFPTTHQGDRIILAENPELFAQENPSHDAAAVVDVNDFPLYDLNNRKYDLDLSGVTSGTFTLEVVISGVGHATGPIAYNADAATIEAALEGLANTGPDTVHCTGGPLPGTPIRITFINDLGSRSDVDLNADFSGLSGGTPALTLVQTGGFPVYVGGGSLFFDEIDVTGQDRSKATLRLYNGPGAQGQAQMAWGNGRTFGTWQPNWVGPTIAPVTTPGHTQRIIFNPDTALGITPTQSDQFWVVEPDAHPGYEPDGTEWLLVELPRLGLELAQDITPSDPPNGGTLYVRNAGGPSTDGLYPSGTIQIGLEQITYTGKGPNGTLTGITRGANGTTPAAHAAGDPMLPVESGVAVDGWPVTRVEIERPPGGMALADFSLRRSRLTSVRTPDQTNYLADYHAWVDVASNTLALWSQVLSPAERLRHLLLEVYRMSSRPARVRVNELRAIIDPAVFDQTAYLSASPVSTIVGKVLEQADLPAGVLIATGTLPTIDDVELSTVTGDVVLQDLADMANVRVTTTRDGRLQVEPDSYWDSDQVEPTSDEFWSRAELVDVQFVRELDPQIGGVRVYWRPPGASGEVYEAVYQGGPGQEIALGSTEGPELLDSSAKAVAMAQKAYRLARRRHTAVMAPATPRPDLRPGRVVTLVWDLPGGRTVQRQYMVEAVTGRIAGYRYDIALRAVQVSGQEDD